VPSGHPFSREVRREFFDRVCGGMAVVDAAQAARSSDGLAPTTIAGLGNVRKRPWVIRLV
jgi:hypothetical protein